MPGSRFDHRIRGSRTSRSANPFTRVAQAKWLVEQGVDAVVTRETIEGRGPYYVFSDAAVKMLSTTAETVADAMAEINAPDTLISPTADGSKDA